MALYTAPPLDRRERDVIARVDEIRARVRFVSVESSAWAQLLVPLFLSSETSGADDAGDAAAAPRSAEPDPAFAGYRRALEYVLSLHDDPHFVYHETLVRSLHYMTLAHDPDKFPGRWRNGTICVYGKRGTEVLYDPPPPELVPGLMGELMTRLNEADEAPAIVRAAIAHLNLVQIHPFPDGNGRMGRALQTLVLVRAGILDPEFSSLEKSVARDRDRYRESLYELGPSWNPAADARPFLRFCLTVHLHQAEQALVGARRMSATWAEAAEAARRERLSERVTAALADAAFAGGVDAAAYRQWARVDERTARADLNRLAGRGFLLRLPGRRAVYTAGPLAREIQQRVWAAEPPYQPVDPFN